MKIRDWSCMAARRKGSVKAEPNLTPILDMVFQLITFFVLVVNFKSAELDLTLNLPVIGSARPAPINTNRLLVLNVENNKGEIGLSVMGVPYRKDAIKPYLQHESTGALAAAGMTFDDVKDGSKELPDMMVIRADAKCPFGHVNYVITSCQEVGFRRFTLKTSARGRGPLAVVGEYRRNDQNAAAEKKSS